MNRLSSSLNWIRITDSFELAFNQAFSTDKKAHFDNLPEEFKIIDGAKGTWSKLLLIDAIIYILVNDSFNSSSRRAFSQNRVLCECILDELAMLDSEAHSALMGEKCQAALTGGHYLAIPDALSRQLAEKYSHLTAHDPLVPPWDSINNVRLSMLTGPPSKAKTKFVTIVDMLTNHHILGSYEFNLDVIIELVICRVLFVFKNHKILVVPLTSLRELPVPEGSSLTTSLLSTAEKLSLTGKVNKITPTNKQKRTPTAKDLAPKKKILLVNSESIASSSSNDQSSKESSGSTAFTNSLYEACVPLQVAASLIPDDLSDILDFDFELLGGDEMFELQSARSAEEVERVKQNAHRAAEKLVTLKDKRVRKRVLKAQKAAQSVVPIVIQKSEDEKLCAIIPVLPLELFEPTGDMMDDGEDGDALFDTDDFDFFNDDTRDLLMGMRDSEEARSRGSQGDGVVSGGSQDGISGGSQEGNGSQEGGEGSKTSSNSEGQSSCISSLTADSMGSPLLQLVDGKDVSQSPPSPHPKSIGGRPSVLIAIDPSTTKYVLIDNVLCAIVPVVNPAMFAAAATHGKLGHMTTRPDGEAEVEMSSDDSETHSRSDSSGDLDMMTSGSDSGSGGEEEEGERTEDSNQGGTTEDSNSNDDSSGGDAGGKSPPTPALSETTNDTAETALLGWSGYDANNSSKSSSNPTPRATPKVTKSNSKNLSISLPCPPEPSHTTSNNKLKSKAFTMGPPMRMDRLNSLCLEDNTSDLQHGETHVCISLETFESLTAKTNT